VVARGDDLRAQALQGVSGVCARHQRLQSNQVHKCCSNAQHALHVTIENWGLGGTGEQWHNAQCALLAVIYSSFKHTASGPNISILKAPVTQVLGTVSCLLSA
jgi:hypothetical protein